MGYSSRLQGEILIDPPLRWSQIRRSKFLPGSAGGSGSLAFRVSEQVVEDDDGERIVRTAVAIEDAYGGDSVKHYEIPAELAEIARAHPGHEFIGTLILIGEEPGAVERYRFDGDRLVAERATLTWPDGTAVEI